MNEFVLNGLVRRRAQLAGDIENTHDALWKMVLDRESLEVGAPGHGDRGFRLKATTVSGG